MTRSGAVPTVVRRALRPEDARCYRHCRDRVRARSPRTSFPGVWKVYSCPGGVVSVTSYAERTGRDPTDRVGAYLRRCAVPKALVTSRDLRLATRHGPELGLEAERVLSRRPPRMVRVVYWRVYPFRGKDGRARRLFVCWRHGSARPRFYSYFGDVARGSCPDCAKRRSSSQRSSD